MPRHPACLLLTGLALAACSRPATQLVIVVDTDYAVPGELAEVRALVESSDGEEVSNATFSVAMEARPQAARFAMPLSFGVVPVDDDASRRVRVVVTGVDPEGRPLVVRSATTGFLEGHPLLLPMFLLRSCGSVECGEGETCDDGICVPEQIDPMTLMPVEPGEELDGGVERSDAADSMDAAASDAGALDAGEQDAGGAPPDAGGDAGAPSDGGALGPRYVRSVAAVSTCGASTTDVPLATGVPAGDVLVVSVIWRDNPGASASITDDRGNVYRPVERVSSGNPAGSLFAASILTPLSPGDSLHVMHPPSVLTITLVDQLSGVMGTATASTTTRDRSVTVTAMINAPSMGVVLATTSNLNNTTMAADGGWTRGSSLPASCGGFGVMDARTYYRISAPGAQSFVGTLGSRQQNLCHMAAFGP